MAFLITTFIYYRKISLHDKKIINFYNNKKHRLISMASIQTSKIIDEKTIKNINKLK